MSGLYNNLTDSPKVAKYKELVELSNTEERITPTLD